MGFMFNRVIGVRGALGYDGVFAQSDSTKKHSNTDIFRITIGGIVSISEWANFSTKRFNLNFHFGVGWSTMSNRQFKKDNPTYDDGKLIAKNDDLGHVIVGITPHIHINDRISFTSDFSFLMLTSYHYNVDYQQSRDIRGWDNYMNLSVGILFRLKTWAPTVGNRPSN